MDIWGDAPRSQSLIPKCIPAGTWTDSVAWDFVAGKLNLTITGDYVAPVIEEESVEETPTEEPATEESPTEESPTEEPAEEPAAEETPTEEPPAEEETITE